MNISLVHLSLTIQYAADASSEIAKLIDQRDLDEGTVHGTIAVTRTALERALRSLKGIPMPEEKD